MKTDKRWLKKQCFCLETTLFFAVFLDFGKGSLHFWEYFLPSQTWNSDSTNNFFLKRWIILIIYYYYYYYYYYFAEKIVTYQIFENRQVFKLCSRTIELNYFYLSVFALVCVEKQKIKKTFLANCCLPLLKKKKKQIKPYYIWIRNPIITPKPFCK